MRIHDTDEGRSIVISEAKTAILSEMTRRGDTPSYFVAYLKQHGFFQHCPYTRGSPFATKWLYLVVNAALRDLLRDGRIVRLLVPGRRKDEARGYALP